MGHWRWKLESSKMAFYMAFPIALFYIFNQPAFFEEWMMKKRKEFFPVKDITARPQIEAAIQKIQKRREDEWNAEWEKATSGSRT